MELIQSYTMNATHPATLKKVRAITFTFDTGHSLTRYEGGVEFFTKSNGQALNKKTGAKVIESMKSLVNK